MYAIFKTGGKQYKAQKGDVLRVEKLTAEEGKKIQISDVLFIGGETPVVGDPLVKGATVTVKVVAQTRNKKIIIFKKKRRHNYRRKNGHRQPVTVVEVVDIKA